MNRLLGAIGRWRPPIWMYAVVATALLIGVVAFPAALVTALITLVQLAILAVAFVAIFYVARWLVNRGGAGPTAPLSAPNRPAAPTQQMAPLPVDPDQTRVMPTSTEPGGFRPDQALDRRPPGERHR